MKPLDRLIRAYDDDGVTEAFVRSALAHINRAYDGDIDVGNLADAPLWDVRQERLDLRLRSCEPERARLAALDLDLDLAAGEELRIEISTKFRIDRLLDELADSDFEDAEWFTDEPGDFALVLARRA